MSNFKSAAEMARAKKMHTCNMAWQPQPAATDRSMATTDSSSAAPASTRRSHAEFNYEKRRHTTDIQCSPRREAATPVKKEAPAMTGPPYHMSCREFAHEKVEHLTPVLPEAHATAGTATQGGMMTSNEVFSSVKRKHSHEMDSLSPRRTESAAGGTERASGAAASPRCTSQERMRVEKMAHRHAMDAYVSGRAHTRAEASGNESPRLTSSEQFNKEKRSHRHGIDEYLPKQEAEPEPDLTTATTGQCVSVGKFSKDKKAHRLAIDEWCPKAPVVEEVDEEGQFTSQIALAKLKKNHDYTLDERSPQREAPAETVKPEKLAKSNHVLTASKKRHDRDMSGIRREAEKSPRLVSNEEYTYDKRRHKHLVDEWRSASGSPPGAYSARSVSGPEGEGPNGQCLSLSRLSEEKRRHSHTMDSFRSGYSGPAAAEAPSSAEKSPRMTSNLTLSSEKRGHRHEIDGGSPPREKAPATHDGIVTSNNELAHLKRGHKHLLDDHRTPRRELFDTSSPPVITSSKPVAEEPASPPTPAEPIAADAAAEDAQ